VGAAKTAVIQDPFCHRSFSARLSVTLANQVEHRSMHSSTLAADKAPSDGALDDITLK
jgi:hypothetical protein